ncbi:MAG: cupin domain-containing protein [Candidatus Gracilibacteria bacterium]
MRGYVLNIEQETLDNNDYRRVLYTAKSSQLVLMCIQPGDEVGEEIHGVDQFLRIEEGEGKVYIDENEYEVKKEFAVIIPQGAKHNVVNTGTIPLRLYSLYSPAEHKDRTVHKTKADEKEEHFDGKTTE